MALDHTVLLGSVVESTIAPQADQVDRAGRFPRSAVTALGEIGLLGLASATAVGGGGAGLAETARVIERLAGVCGSTAMVLLTHYAATAVVEAHGPPSLRGAIARGEHLATLALGEPGDRGAVTRTGGAVVLEGTKTWVTAAGEADSYVWCCGSAAVLVGGDTPGLRAGAPFDGLGLRGCAATSMTADRVEVPADAVVAEGLDHALPVFLVLGAAFSLGLTEAMLADTAGRVPESRELAALRARADLLRVFCDDTVAAVAGGRGDARVRAAQARLAGAETATEIGDRLLRLCGFAAVRKELAVERHYRDALTARVMTPTGETLQEFGGQDAVGQPLFR
ncbi:acyl-CoA dehydrogenase family protein [Amycolatopsis tucumanensis]|uniref:Acyl-CoA dehydrogenase family protein n=1 Tax=Amycolatopsis tucumanensis TaxID=401106 RepID=A0ABP7J2G2_9PSEU|nr:acyl-CoA dehydrogenase family protein [Amycolatopsis tucumanensis]MCF6422162.1 acyl-CoA dehydrogenase family protein [Amycolatopsis tucumanensis]